MKPSYTEPEKTNTETETGKRKHPEDCSTEIKESKRAASFKESWEKGRHWLVFMRGKSMFFQSCQRHKQPWNKQPCKRMRLESVTDHERSVAALKTALKMDYEATYFIFHMSNYRYQALSVFICEIKGSILKCQFICEMLFHNKIHT